jgi:hypothetical protein
MARAVRAIRARPPITPPTIAPTGVCEGVDIGVGVGDVGPGRLKVLVVERGVLVEGLELLVEEIGLLVVGLVVVEISPELDLAWCSWRSKSLCELTSSR